MTCENKVNIISNNKSQWNILVMCLADPSGNPRPRRVIELLNKLDCYIHIASYEIKGKLDYNQLTLIHKKPSHGIQKIAALSKSLILILLSLIVKKKEWQNIINNARFNLLNIKSKLNHCHFDIIIVENIQLLPIAFEIKKKAKVIFDAREYYPREFENSFMFRLLSRPERIRLCNTYLHQCDALITVSNGLAEEYKKEFSVSMQVIRSVPKYVLLPVQSCHKDKIRMIHHGNAHSDRRLENMISIVRQLDERFTLDLFLTGPNNIIKRLKKISRGDSRIRFFPPVPYLEIIPMLNQYDIGFYFLEPTGFNTTHCLPNKLFEFIQARLAVAIGPSPEMAKVIKKFHCGIVSPTFDCSDMIKELNKLESDHIMKMKRASNIAAKELCFDKEGKKLENIIFNLIQKCPLNPR